MKVYNDTIYAPYFTSYTLIDFVSVVQESHTPKPMVKMLQHIADYHSLLDPVVEKLHHSQPWCFSFTYKITCKAEMH